MCLLYISFLLRSSRKKNTRDNDNDGKQAVQPSPDGGAGTANVIYIYMIRSALTNGGCNPIYRCLIFTLHFSLQLLQIRQDFAWALDDLNHIAFQERAELDVTRSSMDWLNGNLFFFAINLSTWLIFLVIHSLPFFFHFAIYRKTYNIGFLQDPLLATIGWYFSDDSINHQ